MKTFALTLMLAFIATDCIAQEHLWPALSEWNGAADHDDYPQIVATVFHDAFHGNIRVRFHATHSMIRREEVIALTQNGSVYSILSMQANVHLMSYSSASWMRDLRPAGLTPSDYHVIKPSRCEANIPSSLAIRIVDVWRAVLLETRYDAMPQLGFDGAWADFSMPGTNQYLDGRIWSPGEGTKPAMLWGIANGMAQFLRKARSSELCPSRQAGCRFGGPLSRHTAG